MTTPTWRAKQGTDWVANADIVCTYQGNPIDFTDPDWSYAAQARSDPQAADEAATFAFVEDERLSGGRLRLKLARADLWDMPADTYYVDLEVLNDALGVGRQVSATWTFEVVPHVSRTLGEEVGS